MDEKTTKQLIRNAEENLDNGYHCSEGILLALGNHYLGKVDPLALRMSTPFAGGLGGTHAELCGALAGGILLIGALYGRADVKTNDDHCQALAKEFREKFRREFGYIHCQDLKDNWVGKPGQETCAILVGRAAGVLIEILENQK